jgi:hypothetical protein
MVSQAKDTSVSVVMNIHFLEDIFLELIENKTLELINQISVFISHQNFETGFVVGLADGNKV